MENSENPVIDNLATLFAYSNRTPILRTPDEYGMAYEDVFFPSLDGVVLEGWFIPADSNKLIICNHFAPGNRYGFPGHIEPWNAFSDFEVNFLPEYKILHDAGYNVLTYDFRNHGRSASGSGGIVGNGLLEYRDVIGSVRYVKSRPDTKNMLVGLRSVCIGANATFMAMAKHPEEFEHIKVMVAPQPISLSSFVGRAVEQAGIENGDDLVNEKMYAMTGLHIKDLSPMDYAHAVKVPTFVTQVHDDSATRPEDVQAIFDKLGTTEKKLFWIEGTTRRFDGYNYLGQHPEMMLEWFSTYFNK